MYRDRRAQRWETGGIRRQGSIRVRLLGALEADDDRGPVALGGHRQRAVLGRLLVDAGRVVSLDALVEDVWDGAPPETAVKTLQKYVSELRKALGADALVTRANGYAAQIPDDGIDARRFEALVAAAHRHRDDDDLAGAATLLRDAEALWRGDVLADFPDAGWVMPARTRLGELRLSALEERLDAEIELGRSGEAAAELSQLVELHPLREGLRRLHVLALSATGRPADALRSYERYRRHLADELGLEPSAALRRLQHAVLERDPSVTPGAPPGPAPRPTNLPRALTSFVGREELLASLDATLRGARLLTLTGPGGAGKSRVAAELARRVLPSHPGGAWLVELAAVGDPAFVPRAVADAVGVGEQPGRDVLDVVSAALVHRAPTLLVVDDCEHLLEAVARLVDHLLRQCPTLHVLATSRVVLDVVGEWVRSVAPLAVTLSGSPPHLARESEAVRLFVDRARLVVPDLELSDDEVITAASICRRLDGLPLAIELAASQLRVLPLADLAERLEDPFGLLRRTRTSADRHATLLTTVEWSHQLLGPSARAVFARCSIFAGPFTVDAATAVCLDVVGPDELMPLLTELVDTSMLVREAPVAGHARFRMLETLRAFGRRQLAAAGVDDDVAAAQAGWFVQLAEAAGPGLNGPDEAAWLASLRAEAPNLRAALAWCRAHDAGLAVRVGVALLEYWISPAGWLDGTTHFCAMVEEVPPASPSLRAWALGVAAYLVADQGESHRPTAWAEEALELFRGLGDGRGEAFALLALGSAFRDAGRLDRAAESVETALGVWRSLGEDVLEARSLSLLGTIAGLRGNYDVAQARFEASLAIRARLGSTGGRALTLWLLGALARARDDDATAEANCRQSIELFLSVGDVQSVPHVELVLGDVARERGDLVLAGEIYGRLLTEFRQAGDQRCTASTLKNLGMLAAARGDTPTAASHFVDALVIRHDLGDDGGLAECLDGLSELSLADGRPERAASLSAAASSLRERTGVRSPARDRRRVEQHVEAVRRRLRPDAFARHWAAGLALDSDRAAELGLS